MLPSDMKLQPGAVTATLVGVAAFEQATCSAIKFPAALACAMNESVAPAPGCRSANGLTYATGSGGASIGASLSALASFVRGDWKSIRPQPATAATMTTIRLMGS